MFKIWDNATVNFVSLAMFVPNGTGQGVHRNRQYHGFVINDSNSEKIYTFSDGTVLKTKEKDVFYLPKGSSYQIKSIAPGGCYAINFDTTEDINCPPFIVKFRDEDRILKCFKNSEKLWRQRPPYYRTGVLKYIYEIINLIGKEFERDYISNDKKTIINTAVEKIHSSFTDNNLSVAELANMSGVSEAYFRRLFIAKYGVAPKEYITRLRISYAKRLLISGDFSVSEVALLCGYSEPCHFSREFSKKMGISPKKFPSNNNI